MLAGWLLVAGVAQADELHLKYRVERKTQHFPAEGAGRPQADSPKDEQTTETLTIGLGEGYFFEEAGGKRTIHDFRTKRIRTVNLIESTYDEYSLYAVAAFRSAEIINRLAINHLMHQVASQPGDTVGGRPYKPEKLFDLETIFCVELRGEEVRGLRKAIGQHTKEKAKPAVNGQIKEFTYEGQTVVRFIPSRHTLTGGIKQSLGHSLLYRCHMHPDIRRQIEGEAVVPKLLYYRMNDVIDTYEVTYNLLSAETKNCDSSSVPARFRKTHGEDKQLAAILAELEGKDLNAKATVANVESFVKEAASRESYLDAMLAMIEYNLQTDGTPSDGMIEALGEHADEDERFRNFGHISGMPKNTRQAAQQKLDAYESADTEGLQKAYLLNIFKGNLKACVGEGEEGKKLLLSALQSNPYITGVYHDLGHMYYRGYDMVSAWRCWDAARQLCPSHRMLWSVTALERSLEKCRPEYFRWAEKSQTRPAASRPSAM